MRPDFGLTAANAPVVEEICRRLDGLPLAIELAAARLAHLGPRSLLAHLDLRLPLLTTGARDIPARHRTMHDAIAWSVDLLGPAERDLFARLGVFAGSFTFEAAEAISRETRVESRERDRRSLVSRLSTLDSLGTLIDASLVRMLPDEVVDEVRSLLASWLIDLSKRMWPQTVTAERDVWFARLAAEVPNLHAALGWVLDRGDAETALRLIVGSVYYRWDTQGLLATEGRWLGRALDVAAAAPERIEPVLHARGLMCDGMGCYQAGDYDRARMCLEAAVAILRATGDHHWLMTALGNLAAPLQAQGDYKGRGGATTRRSPSIATATLR